MLTIPFMLGFALSHLKTQELPEVRSLTHLLVNLMIIQDYIGSLQGIHL